MTEPAFRRPLPVARIALAGAATIAIVAVGGAVWRSRPAPAPVVAPAPAGDMRSVVAALEARLAASPQDAEGWRMLGVAYYETGRYGDAARAYERATALRPREAGLWSALGEARVLAGQGGVTPPAVQAFAEAVKLDAQDPRARYFLAVKQDMDGDHKGAIDAWIALLKDSPPDAPWTASVRDVLMQASAKYGIAIAGRIPAPAPVASAGDAAGDQVATAGIPGPSRDQMTAAAALPPSQQAAMVEGMVASLAAKLRADPRDPDGWIRLVRARMVLGDRAAAGAALAAGKAANPGDVARLDAAAAALGM